jgi:hypothetical protein
MKAVQTWVTIVVLVLVIFVVTLLSQSLSNPRTPDGGPIPPPEDKPPTLIFPVQVVKESTVSEITPVKGWRDFWFENVNPVPLEVALLKMSCKCSKVELLVFKKDEEKVFEQWQNQSELLAVTGNGGLLPTLVATVATDLAVRGFVGAPERWQSLMYEGRAPKFLPVPAQSQGLVRLTWEGKEPRPQLLTAKLETRVPGQPNSEWYNDLEMPVQFVDMMHVDRPTIDVDELLPGTQKSALFPCFSPTRAAVNLTAREKSGDACVQCSVLPLTSQQREILQLQRAGEKALPILGGYVVVVTVSERAGDKQLDLGPFQREIVLSSDDSAETHTLTVKGVVMGEIRLLGEQQKHRVDLSLFDSQKGTTVNLILETDRPTIKLEPDSHYPDYLEVDLKETGSSPAGGRQWKLTVTVPRDKAFGRLPPESVVVLKTQDAPPRRFRIPVAGHGTMR